MEHLRHDPGTISVPDGHSLEDLDWTILSWDLRMSNGNFVQHVIAPGVLLSRTGLADAGTWRIRPKNPPEGYHMKVSRDIGEPVMDAALRNTEVNLKLGYVMSMEPFTFMMEPERFSYWPKEYSYMSAHTKKAVSFPFETLGDVIRWGGDTVLRDVFNEATKRRRVIAAGAK